MKQILDFEDFFWTVKKSQEIGLFCFLARLSDFLFHGLSQHIRLKSRNLSPSHLSKRLESRRGQSCFPGWSNISLSFVEIDICNSKTTFSHYFQWDFGDMFFGKLRWFGNLPSRPWPLLSAVVQGAWKRDGNWDNFFHTSKASHGHLGWRVGGKSSDLSAAVLPVRKTAMYLDEICFFLFDLLELVCMICSLMGLLSCCIKPFVDSFGCLACFKSELPANQVLEN